MVLESPRERDPNHDPSMPKHYCFSLLLVIRKEEGFLSSPLSQLSCPFVASSTQLLAVTFFEPVFGNTSKSSFLARTQALSLAVFSLCRFLPVIRRSSSRTQVIQIWRVVRSAMLITTICYWMTFLCQL